MSSKSKHNRRDVEFNKKMTTNSAGFDKAVTSPMSSTQPEKSAPLSNNVTKEKTAMNADSPYFLQDLKWTGIVGGIVLILLIIAFFLFS